MTREGEEILQRIEDALSEDLGGVSGFLVQGALEELGVSRKTFTLERADELVNTVISWLEKMVGAHVEDMRITATLKSLLAGEPEGSYTKDRIRTLLIPVLGKTGFGRDVLETNLELVTPGRTELTREEVEELIKMVSSDIEPMIEHLLESGLAARLREILR